MSRALARILLASGAGFPGPRRWLATTSTGAMTATPISAPSPGPTPSMASPSTAPEAAPRTVPHTSASTRWPERLRRRRSGCADMAAEYASGHARDEHPRPVSDAFRERLRLRVVAA